MVHRLRTFVVTREVTVTGGIGLLALLSAWLVVGLVVAWLVGTVVRAGRARPVEEQEVAEPASRRGR